MTAVFRDKGGEGGGGTASKERVLSKEAQKILAEGFMGLALEQIQGKLQNLQNEHAEVFKDKLERVLPIRELLDELHKLIRLLKQLKDDDIKPNLRSNAVIFLRRSLEGFSDSYNLRKAVREGAVLFCVGTATLEEITQAVSSKRSV